MLKQQDKASKPSGSCSKKYLYGPVATVFNSAKTGTWRLSMPVFDQDSCTRCGNCAKFCPLDIITVPKDKSQPVTVDLDYCKGCGVCVDVCPKNCIKLESEQRGGE